ncbi:MAG: hypothetical protein BWX44_00035 [Spirochaetes bacterium ADurb.Bin001]|nr:MAG: hypothetical protein BWX44_00035 [Spirochaetes bacterium ADurb.Bin001]
MPVQNEAIASYTGLGRRRIIENIIWHRPPARRVDPLAQTFVLTEDRFVTSIGLFFGTKDATKTVTVQIRNVVNGYPGDVVLVEKSLLPAAVGLSADSSIETKFTFDEPVLLLADTEYAITALTNSDQYRVYVARMAGTDLVTGQKVTRQPYTVGVMFSSSNATAWTAHQEIDLKFKIYGAVFEDEAILQFSPVAVTQVGQLIIAASQLVPRGTQLRWQWSSDGSQWFPLANDDVTLLSATIETAYVRAVLRKGLKCSPAIQHKSATLVGMAYKGAGVYISREKTAPAFTTATIYVDLHTPSGTTQALQYSVDGGAWAAAGAAVSSQQVDEQFTQYKYKVTLGAPATKIRVRINATSDSKLVTPKARRLMLILS